MKIWDGSIIYELSEMVIEQDDGMVVPKYLSWFKKRVIIADIPEGSSRKRKDQQTIEWLKGELEQARETIAQQQVQIQLKNKYHLAMQDMEGYLRQAEEKIVRLEEELESRISLARQVKRGQNAGISQLKRDLDTSREALRHQQVEFNL